MTSVPAVADRLSTALADHYRVDRELGAGGMATVYLARDLFRHDRDVALKVLKPDLAAVIGAERFLNEIKTTANLQHPPNLPLHDSGEASGTVWYVMPLVEGDSLRTPNEWEMITRLVGPPRWQPGVTTTHCEQRRADVFTLLHGSRR